MTKINRLNLLIAAFAILSSCGKKESTPSEEASKHESPKEIAIAVFGEMETMMKAGSSVTDTASAKEAAEKMATLSANMNALAAQLSTMEKPSPEVKKEIEAEMQKRMDAAMKDMSPPNPADINIEEAEEIEKIMTAAQEKFEADTKDAQKTFDDYFNTEDAPDTQEVAPVE